MEKNSRVIDMELGMQLARNNRALAVEMLGLLVESLPQELASILAAYHENNYAILQKRVHKLHGAVCYCGVPGLKQIIKNIEIALKEQQLDNLPTLMTQLESEASSVQDEVIELLSDVHKK